MKTTCRRGSLDEPVGPPGAVAIRRSASLLWYRGITWKLKLIGGRRGYYPISPLKITSGDFLGLYFRSRRAGGTEHLIVYTRIFPVDTRLIPALYPMGEARAARRLFRDPTHAIGVREYFQGDGLKLIHWKATARRGDLQVKVLDATTAFNVAMVLAVESFRDNGVLAEADLPKGISAAGSIAAALCERGSPVGLFVNTRLADTGQPAVIAPGAGRNRVTEILEALAKVTDRSSGPTAAFLGGQKERLTAGTTVIFILGRLPDRFSEQLADLRAAGSRTAGAAHRRARRAGPAAGCPLAPDPARRRPGRRLAAMNQALPRGTGALFAGGMEASGWSAACGSWKPGSRRARCRCRG